MAAPERAEFRTRTALWPCLLAAVGLALGCSLVLGLAWNPSLEAGLPDPRNFADPRAATAVDSSDPVPDVDSAGVAGMESVPGSSGASVNSKALTAPARQVSAPARQASAPARQVSAAASSARVVVSASRAAAGRRLPGRNSRSMILRFL